MVERTCILLTNSDSDTQNSDLDAQQIRLGGSWRSSTVEGHPTRATPSGYKIWVHLPGANHISGREMCLTKDNLRYGLNEEGRKMLFQKYEQMVLSHNTFGQIDPWELPPKYLTDGELETIKRDGDRAWPERFRSIL